MTFKSMMNFGGFYTTPYTPAIDRYHHGHSDYSHKRHKSKGKGGGGGVGGGGSANSGAALSALTLLAFLFLLNVMQQSLMDNNATVTTASTRVLLRENDQPISLSSRLDVKPSYEEEPTENPVKDEFDEDTAYVKISDY